MRRDTGVAFRLALPEPGVWPPVGVAPAPLLLLALGVLALKNDSSLEQEKCQPASGKRQFFLNIKMKSGRLEKGVSHVRHLTWSTHVLSRIANVVRAEGFFSVLLKNLLSTTMHDIILSGSVLLLVLGVTTLMLNCVRFALRTDHSRHMPLRKLNQYAEFDCQVAGLRDYRVRQRTDGARCRLPFFVFRKPPSNRSTIEVRFASITN